MSCSPIHWPVRTARRYIPENGNIAVGTSNATLLNISETVPPLFYIPVVRLAGCFVYSFTLRMEAERFSEISANSVFHGVRHQEIPLPVA
jgi:hypothetical protein